MRIAQLFAVILALALVACDDDPEGRAPSIDALISGGARPPDGAPRDAAPPVDAARPVDAAPPDAARDLGCQADCTGRICGDDGCGGDCGLCSDTERCLAGVCVLEGCRGGLNRCDGVCLDVATEVDHCGGCGQPCLRPEGARVRCEAGVCVYVCLAADGAPEEVDPLSDRRHCGACGQVCPEACYEGGCVPATCRATLEAVVDCLVTSDACPGVQARDAERILREGRTLCQAPGLFALVQRAVAEQDCPAIIGLAGDTWCFPN